MIAAIGAATDDAARARLLRDGARGLLFDPSAIADVAAAAINPADDVAGQAAAALLSSALDEARMATENGVPEGASLTEALATALTAWDSAHPFAPELRLRLAQIYARAGLAPPPFATLSADVMAKGNVAPEDMPDLDALLNPIFRELGDEPIQVHAALVELLAGLPPELAAMLVSMTIARQGALETRLGLYWLFDPKPDLRLAAATALLSLADAGTLVPELGALLPALRKLLPDDPARAALDGAIRRHMRIGGARTKSSISTIHRAAASLPDGAGAQSLIAAVQVGGRRAVAMAMLKQGHGLKDAFLIPCGSATEQKHMLTCILDEIETFGIPPETLAEALARGLGEGLALGLMPAPGLVDLVEILGPDALIPVSGEAGAILVSIGAAETLASLPAAGLTDLLNASADWINRFDQADSWFEDTTALRAALARARTRNGQEAAVWKHIEARRDWWARHFAVSAATLKYARGLDPTLWLACAAVARAILDGLSLNRIPIMADIAAMTLEANAASNGNVSARSRSGAQEDMGSLLAQAGMNEAYLQGYLTALVITPLEPSPEDWLGSLLSGIEFPGEGVIDRLIGFIMDHANQTDHDAGDPKAVSQALDALKEGGLKDWAAGFDDLVKATRRSWSPKLLAADDKRVLRDIEQIAKGGEAGALRAVLPSWVARRYATRR